MAIANDGYALVATGALNVHGGSNALLYSLASGTFTGVPATLYSVEPARSPMMAASADGSVVLATQSGLSPSPPVMQYNPETTLFKPTSISINQRYDETQAMDSSGAKRAVYDGSTNSVYDSNSQLLGTIPGPVWVLTVNRQGTRLYALNQDSTLHTYDLTAPTVNGSYPEITHSALTVPASSTSVAVRLEPAPDGGTLFLTGDTGVAVIPAP
jgi:hypothetical protein